MKKDLLKLLDLTTDDIKLILDTGDKLKAELKAGKKHDFPVGKTLAMIFAKNSTRTRVSFEVGMFQLGGHAIFMSTSDSQLSRGEPIKDTARNLSRYCDGIMIRTYHQDDVEEFARYASIPVINGLTDFAHPCQTLADLMTIREYKGNLEGLKACWIGDGNNVANSTIVGCLKMGMNVSIACPDGYHPDKQVLDFAKSISADGSVTFELTDNPRVAASGADVVFTDVWTSMGQEEEAQARLKAFKGYIINHDLMALTNSGCMVQHCLPAHKGEEICEEVFEEHADEIFEEAENRLHVQKAVMYLLMK